MVTLLPLHVENSWGQDPGTAGQRGCSPGCGGQIPGGWLWPGLTWHVFNCFVRVTMDDWLVGANQMNINWILIGYDISWYNHRKYHSANHDSTIEKSSIPILNHQTDLLNLHEVHNLQFTIDKINSLQNMNWLPPYDFPLIIATTKKWNHDV